jgi:AraC-like DNA-binding protein
MPAILDLDIVREGQRADAWRNCARTYFPGLSVRGLDFNPGAGTIAGAPFGGGRLWAIVSPAVHVHYDPAAVSAAQAQRFSVMLQMRGTTRASQSGRSARLEPGDVCVIDSASPFELSVDDGLSQLIVLQMPRVAVLSRHPHLEQCTAELFEPNEAGATLLSRTLLSTLDLAPSLDANQSSAALGAIIQLVGVPKLRGAECPSHAVEWRSRAALAMIDACLSDLELTAERVAGAQGISRRRLDEIMVRATGCSVSSHIWSRRLERAASDLLDRRFAGRTITQVAFASGFKDGAHFTRAFKRRYRTSPSGWRRTADLTP